MKFPVFVVQMLAADEPERWVSISAHLTEGEATTRGMRLVVELDLPVWRVRLLRQVCREPKS